jgi:small-conductance mechanosensitive channel
MISGGTPLWSRTDVHVVVIVIIVDLLCLLWWKVELMFITRHPGITTFFGWLLLIFPLLAPQWLIKQRIKDHKRHYEPWFADLIVNELVLVVLVGVLSVLRIWLIYF